MVEAPENPQTRQGTDSLRLVCHTSVCRLRLFQVLQHTLNAKKSNRITCALTIGQYFPHSASPYSEDRFLHSELPQAGRLSLPARVLSLVRG